MADLNLIGEHEAVQEETGSSLDVLGSGQGELYAVCFKVASVLQGYVSVRDGFRHRIQETSRITYSISKQMIWLNFLVEE